MPDELGAESIALSYFENRASSAMNDTEAVDWSKRVQTAGFSDLLSAVDIENRSIVDYGCGTGALVAHLRNNGIRATYTGVDFSPSMISRAQRNFSNEQFLLGSVEVVEARPPIDVVVAIGTFNIDFAGIEQKTHHALSSLFRKSRQALYASFTIRNPTVSFSPNIKAWEPESLLNLAESITPCVRIGRHYLPHHMSITLFHEWQSPPLKADR